MIHTFPSTIFLRGLLQTSETSVLGSSLPYFDCNASLYSCCAPSSKHRFAQALSRRASLFCSPHRHTTSNQNPLKASSILIVSSSITQNIRTLTEGVVKERGSSCVREILLAASLCSRRQPPEQSAPKIADHESSLANPIILPHCPPTPFFPPLATVKYRDKRTWPLHTSIRVSAVRQPLSDGYSHRYTSESQFVGVHRLLLVSGRSSSGFERPSTFSTTYPLSWRRSAIVLTDKF